MKDLQLQLPSDGCSEGRWMEEDGREMFTNDRNREGGGKSAVLNEVKAICFQNSSYRRLRREEEQVRKSYYGNGQKEGKKSDERRLS